MLPKYGPEELNLAAVVDKQVKMECAIDSVSARIDQGHLTTVALESKLEFFNSTLAAQIEKLTSICNELATLASTLYGRRHQVHTNTNTGIDRSMNIVVFGVTEDLQSSVSRC